MGRDGFGHAWRDRQWIKKSSRPRELAPRELKEEPQFKFKDIYITPLRQKRHLRGGRVRQLCGDEPQHVADPSSLLLRL